MIKNPKPSNQVEALEAIEKDDKKYRKVFCTHYSFCLDYADANKWKGFKCTSCTVEEEIAPAQKSQDMVGLIGLAGEILRK